MALTFGFYNSFDGDRKYNALEMSSIFDGIIADGVYESIGGKFMVKATTENTVSVGTGRAWFDHTWTLNDELILLDLEEPEAMLNRWDAVILEINNEQTVRANDIKVIKGTPNVNPTKPSMIKEERVHQYPLAYIYRTHGALQIHQADITNTIGTAECPFVAGILENLEIDDFIAQWTDKWDLWFEKTTTDCEEFVEDFETETTEWVNNFEAEIVAQMTEWYEEQDQIFQDWFTANKETFQNWYADLNYTLSEDAGGKLKVDLNHEAITRILLTGFDDGQKVVSENGRIITHTASTGQKLVKTFSKDFDKLETILYSEPGAEIVKQVKTFSEDGSIIDIEVDYLL